MPEHFDPLYVWLDKGELLVIRRGDRLADIARSITEALPLAVADARQYVAYLFALGERHARGDDWGRGWDPAELDPYDARRYLVARGGRAIRVRELIRRTRAQAARRKQSAAFRRPLR